MNGESCRCSAPLPTHLLLAQHIGVLRSGPLQDRGLGKLHKLHGIRDSDGVASSDLSRGARPERAVPIGLAGATATLAPRTAVATIQPTHIQNSLSRPPREAPGSSVQPHPEDVSDVEEGHGEVEAHKHAASRRQAQQPVPAGARVGNIAPLKHRFAASRGIASPTATTLPPPASCIAQQSTAQQAVLQA